MPRSIFLGRPWPQAGEALWLAEDRWWALALLEAEAGVCRECGMVLAESTDGGHEYAYDAQVVACHGCKAAARRAKAVEGGGVDMTGAHMSVWKREAGTWE